MKETKVRIQFSVFTNGEGEKRFLLSSKFLLLKHLLMERCGVEAEDTFKYWLEQCAQNQEEKRSVKK